MQTRLIDARTVERTADFGTIIPAIRTAFGAYAQDNVVMPPKSYIELPEYNGDFRAMPAYLDTGEWDAAGIKWVNVHPDNPDDHDLPTVLGLVIYSDPETAYPLAIIDGATITRLRTGAAAGVATDILAAPEARSLGLVGAGVQSYSQLEAIASVRPIETVVVADVDQAAVDRFTDHWGDRFEVRAGTPAAAAGCDILSTLTPVREPLIHRDAVEPGTHINAIGADAPGKRELSTDLLEAATIIIDDYEQCTHSGEINVPWSEGRLDDSDLYAELGDLVLGTVPLPDATSEITVFDSTGLAIQDIATAHVIYEAVLDGDASGDIGTGKPFDFFDVESDR